MSKKQIAAAYRLAYGAHLCNIQAYADGQITADVLKSSANELKRLRALFALHGE